MDPIGFILGLLISAGLLVVAGYFILRQWQTLKTLQVDTKLPTDQRLYLHRQAWRRLFGAALLTTLGIMLFGSLFLDYNPHQLDANDVPQVDKETAKRAVHFLTFYLATMLLIVMAILMFAVLDFWAIARYGVQQQKQLAQEHQEQLAADLAEHRYRQSE